MNHKDANTLSMVKHHVVKPVGFREGHSDIFGWDTEYDSVTRDIISFQVADTEGNAHFVPRERLDSTALSRWMIDHYPRRRRYMLVTYASLAEIGCLEDWLSLTPKEIGRCVHFSWRYRGKSFHVYDLHPWFQCSLAKAAASMGFQKLDFDTSQVDRSCLNDAKFVEYAKRDASLMVDMFTRLRATFLDRGVDIVKYPTPAGAAAYLYRQRLAKPLYHPESLDHYTILRAYHGANNQAFFRGQLDGPIVEYDAASMYPASAVQIGKFPTADQWRNGSQLTDNGFYHVRFSFPPRVFAPCLPVEVNKSLIYPLRGESWCTGHEVRLADELGADIDILDGVFCENPSDDTLAEFLSEALAAREKAKARGDVIAGMREKLIANSLIGKMAQHRYDWPIEQVLKLAQGDPRLAGEYMRCANLDQFGVRKKWCTGPVFLPEWAGLILGRARATLCRYQSRCEGRLVQSITDCVIGHDLPRIEKIDGIRWAKKNAGDRIVSYGLRRYAISRYGDVVKRATGGVHPSVDVGGRLTHFRQDAAQVVTTHRLTRFRESIRNECRPFTSIEKTSTISWSWDNKRRLLPDGWSVPWENLEAMEESG